MNDFPSSIENSLQDAGFSGTEILILKRLLEDKALTLRQLASKTGKSTGVLDQAMKKLLKKGIISKEVINDQSMYTVGSLDAICDWIEEDVHKKRESLLRKFQDFESFITSVRLDQIRPDVEQFEGLQGIKQAYSKLLRENEEIVAFAPVEHEESREDPLQDFRVEFFRERKRRNIFSRVIVHDTPQGRRFQSRDAFEYRKTILIPKDKFPLSFEKVIAGNAILSVNHQEKRACLIRYPDLAKIEKALFEAMWCAYQSNDVQKSDAPCKREKIPIKTQFFSIFREFFSSPKMIGLLASFALFAALLSYGVYEWNVHMATERLRDQVKAIAATAAVQFDWQDLEKIRTPRDMQRPEYRELIWKLNEIRRNNPNVQYAYVMRKDSLDIPISIIDADESFIIETNIPQEKKKLFANLTNHSFDSTPTNANKYSFVEFINLDSANNSYLFLEGNFIDSFSYLSYLSLFFLFFSILLVIKILSIKKTQKILYEILSLKKIIVISLFILQIIFWFSFFEYFNYLDYRFNKIANDLKIIVSSSVDRFNSENIDKIKYLNDMNSIDYQNIFSELVDVRGENSIISYAYILRPTKREDLYQFVADADSNFFLPFSQDQNSDGNLDDADEAIVPGTYYSVPFASRGLFRKGEKGPSVSTRILSDQWGSFITAVAPIKRNADTIALLAIDSDVSSTILQLRIKFLIILISSGCTSVVLAFLLKKKNSKIK